MPDQLQLRGGTTAQHTSFTGASKEVTVDTTKKTAVVHDGSTVGGVPLLREDGSNSALTLGSAGTPSIKFTGDLNTGVFSPGADQVAISTGGTSRLAVSTTAVSSTLAVDVPLGAVGTPSLTFTGDTNTGIFSPGADQLAVSTGGTQKLIVLSDGKVGISTSSPTSALDISYAGGTSNIDNLTLKLGADVGNLTSRTINTRKFAVIGAANYSNATKNIGMMYLDSDVSTSRLWFGGGATGIYDATEINFVTAATTTSTVGLQRMIITSGGLVGIGTSSPGGKLDIRDAGTTIPALGAVGTGLNVRRTDGAIGLIIGYENTIGGSYIQAQHTNGSAAAYPLYLQPNGGNVGIGTTSPSQPLEVAGNARVNGVVCLNNAPSAWSSAKAFEGQYGGSLSFDEGFSYTTLASNSFYDGSNWKYKISVGASRYSLGDLASGGTGTHQWFRAASGTAGNTISWLESMRLDGSGRLLVGISSSRSNFNNAGGNDPLFQIERAGGVGSLASIVRNENDAFGPVLEIGKSRGTAVGSYAVVSNNDNLGRIFFNGSDGTDMVPGAAIEAFVDGTPGANDLPTRLVFSVTGDGSASPTERLRISNTGRTVLLESSGGGFEVASTLAAGTDNLFTGYHGATNTTTKGTPSYAVRTNGNVLNTNNSYGALSDIKLKENIVNANSQWDDLKALQVRNYNFKEGQTHTQIGLVAQEAELVSPGLVNESPDCDAEGNDLGTVTKSVNYSVLYMKAVKALQEAMGRIETLEQRLTAAGID